MHRLITRLACLSTALFVGAAAYAQVPRYTLEILGTLGGHESDAYGINDAGTIVGSAAVPIVGTQEFQHAAVYSQGHWTDLGVVGTAYAINSSGMVVGQIRDPYQNHAFAYSGGSFINLGGVLSSTDSGAYAVNNDGVVLSLHTTLGALYTVTTSQNGIATVLPVSGSPAGAGINNHGVIASSFPTGEAYRYSNGTLSLLPTLGGDQNFATAINDAGTIVGFAQTGGPPSERELHAFSTDGNTILDLGTLGGDRSFATAINAGGTIVGWADNGIGGTQRAWVEAGGEMNNLNSLTDGLGDFQLDYAYGINTAGQIVGVGFTPDGDRRGFVLTPAASTVPEPAAAVPLIGVLFTAAWVALRRSHARRAR
jgi:chitinase